ncbi:hypothetical protein KPL74_04430 [Bacillus sp. NP157]|nr:hypothetical protein KPL74_04430 [Bacillus sp. NP157]
MAKKLTKGQSIGLFAIGMGAIWFMAAHSDENPAARASTPTAEVAETAKPESAPTGATPESNIDIARKMDLTEAIETTRPAMTDTVDDTSPGTAAFAFWATAAPMKWNELMGLTRTKAPLVFKDPDEQRGKLLCAAGEIVEITAERSDAGKIYLGGLVDKSGTIYRFAAVGSTGDLVQGSSGAFCGVVTGRVDYSNSGGGTTHAIQLVGMFKLPANAKAVDLPATATTSKLP